MHPYAFQLLLFIYSELSLYLCLQLLISFLVFAFCISLFPDCCVSRIRYPFLFPLRLDGSNRFSGHLQQDCLGTFPEIFWGDLILCSQQCRKPVGHLCCELYCFVFLEFLENQRLNQCPTSLLECVTCIPSLECKFTIASRPILTYKDDKLP